MSGSEATGIKIGIAIAVIFLGFAILQTLGDKGGIRWEAVAIVGGVLAVTFGAIGYLIGVVARLWHDA